MVAVSKTDIPDNIVTIEQLAAWCVRILQSVSPQLLIVEIAGSSPELIVSSSPFPVLSDPNDYHQRLINRLSLRLNENWDSQKLWLAVQEVSTAAIPAAYRQV